MGPASVHLSPEGFEANTGRYQQRWRLTPQGALTVSLSGHADSEWVGQPAWRCDWNLHGLLDANAEGQCLSLQCNPCVNRGDTSDCLQIEAVFAYPTPGFDVRYTVWVYPNAPGVRTAIALRPQHAFTRHQLPSYLGGASSQRLHLRENQYRIIAAGYYNDTQHRNFDHTRILQERCWPHDQRPKTIDWANFICIETADRGLAIIKESHKCVNQSGVDTGEFIIDGARVSVTGLGLTPFDNAGGFWADNVGRWRSCWATWMIGYQGGEAERQLAIKQFDRCRYPFRPQRDRWIMSNTWGSRGAGEGSRSAAEQANVLRELQSANDLGIELVQIDDGWQTAADEPEPVAKERSWRPSTTRWPDGWNPLRKVADELGVELGLWLPWYVDLEKIDWNIQAGGFRRIKLDFMNLHSRHDIEAIETKVEQLVKRQTHPLGVNWDATENAGRMGYFFGRDHGNIYLANRENGPAPLKRLNHIRYTPRLMLRDAWHLAHYINLNQIQLSVQNIDRVITDLSNCDHYTHDYCFAITLMAVPLFFQETQFYSPQARESLRPEIQLYKQHRDAMLVGYVFPIGEEPCDAAWTGFQSHDAGANCGYLTVFRELHNPEAAQTLCLRFLPACRLRLTNLHSNHVCDLTTGIHGEVDFAISNTPGWGFYKYQMLE